MKRIIIFCSDKSEIKDITAKLKNNYEFSKIKISSQENIFESDDVKIKIKIPNKNCRGDRYNICLFTDKVNIKSRIVQEVCLSKLISFSFDTSKNEYKFMGNINMLDKILRNDLTYIVIRYYEDSHDIEFVTNNLAEALYQVKEKEANELHMIKDNIEIANWSISYCIGLDELTLNSIARFEV